MKTAASQFKIIRGDVFDIYHAHTSLFNLNSDSDHSQAPANEEQPHHLTSLTIKTFMSFFFLANTY